MVIIMVHVLAGLGTPDPSVTGALTSAAPDILATLLAAGALGVGISVGVIGLRKGFTFFRSLIKI
jgi:hypothetical protein